jgi:hypothetical protein
MNIREILKGTTAGNLQTVGIMQVIPLLSEIEFTDFVAPGAQANVGTRNYGVMSFDNTSDKTMIIPNNAAYLTKQAAQDHGMTHAGLVKAKSTKQYETAACVQQTQGGYISKGAHEFTIMPFSIRESSINKRKTGSYSKLWEDIQRFNTGLGITGRAGHLEYFYDKFKKELDEFAAEFETVAKQVGAIILVNGQVVGVEKAPNYDYWKTLWKELIRGCYASLALEVSTKNKMTEKDLNRIRVKLNTSKIKTLDDLESQLNLTENMQKERVSKIVRDLIDDNFTEELDETLMGAKTQRLNLKHKQFIGQAIKEGESIVYASLVATNDWIKNEKWHTAEEFKI